MAGKGKVKGVASRPGLGLALLVAVFAAFPAGASALSSPPSLGSFCEPTGLGSAPCEPSFVKPEGMAVDQESGDLLVIDREAGTVSRYHQNGTPADFTALGTNAIDGEGSGPPCTPPSIECDGTPKGHLAFGGPGEVQVAVDNSGGETDGDIYVTQTAAGVVDIFGSDGSYLGQLSESTEGSLLEPCGVAVDPAGSVYVGDFSGKIHKFEPAANPVSNGDSSANFPFAENCTLAAGAGASAGSLFAVRFEGVVVKLDSTTGAQKYTVRSDNDTTVTVNPENGHLYVAAGSSVFEYKASDPGEATLLSEITPGGEKAAGIAVGGASANLYVAHNVTANLEVWGPAEVLPEAITEESQPVGAESATLNGTVNPEGLPLAECYFEYDTIPYTEGGPAHGKTAPCEEPDAAGVGEGTSAVAVHAEISGLEAGTTYHFRLIAVNANGSDAGNDETLFTLGASIKDETASFITTTSARLSAKVNPNGEETAYTFEYVSETQFEASEGGGYAQATSLPSPPGEAGSGSEFIEVGVQLLGLEPDTTYRFRLTAATLATTHFGPDKSFTTHAFSTIVLPDERAYELVSPAQKIGEVYPPEPLAIWTGSCKDCLPGINDEQMPMQATDDGDAVVYEGSPFTGGLASGPNEYLSERSAAGWAMQGLSTPLFARGEEQGYKAFSADLSRGVLSQIEPALSPEAPLRGEDSFANLYLRSEDGTLTPLVSEEPPQRAAGAASLDRFRIGFAGANAGAAPALALSHVIFEANDALTEEVPGTAPPAPAIEANERNLYEWVDGQLALVNVAPGNTEAVSGAVFGSGRELTEEEEGSGVDFDGAISADGSRAFFSEKASGQVYVRIDGEETKQIDDTGKFLVASADGSRVLLNDGCLYDVDAEQCEADLTQDEGGFEGILGAAEDLSRIYFVDSKELAPGAEDAKPNLYAWDEGAADFIATLDEGDNEFNGVVQPQVGDWMPSSSSRTAQVSPDGRFLAFMSRAPLTKYDNHVRGGDECRPNEPAPCFEVFQYRADSEELVCVSCNPSGERPLGTANLSLIYRGKRSVAGFPQPTNLSGEEGRLFFESQDALTLDDLNGRIKDVYEWEPNGVGSCKRAAGCISLISSGQGPNDSIFLDATASGNDAFFITRDRLLPPDQDEKLDLYDARVGGGIEEAPTPPCGGEPCRAPSTSPPALQGPASGSFNGPGNAQPKHKKHHKKHKRHHKGGGHR